MSSSSKRKEYRKWSLEELEGEAERLAALRTEVRLDQNEVSAQIELKRALSGLSENAKATLALSGAVEPKGEVA